VTAIADAPESVAVHERPRVRDAIAVLVARFPVLNEPYILREINELERHGQPVVLVPIVRQHSGVMHDEAKPWLRRALYTALLSPEVIAANVSRFVASPRAYLRLFFEVTLHSVLRPSLLWRTVALFPKSVYLAKALPREGVRHVHAHFATNAAMMAYIISSLSDITYSFTVHGPDIFVKRAFLREKIRRAKFIRAVSTFNKAFLVGLFPEEAGNKVEVVHIGVNPEVYEEARAESRHTRPLPQVITVATLSPFKGLSYLVDAIAKLKREGYDVECSIVGDGPTRHTLQKWIEKQDVADRVTILGARPQHDVARLISESDVFVLPSVIAHDGQMDGIPISLMEAMAAGVPVIASAISGIPELVRNEICGILVDATNAEQLAISIRRVTENNELRATLARAAQEKVRQEFDVRRTVTELIDLLDRNAAAAPEMAEEVGCASWPGLKIQTVGVRAMHQRRDSAIAEITAFDGVSVRDLIVKRQRSRAGESSAAADRARHEFEVLTELRLKMTNLASEATSQVAYTVPRAIQLDLTNASVLMERARGKSLADVVRNARNRRVASRASMPLRRAGVWLRMMQSETVYDDDGRNLLTAIVVIALRDLDLAAVASKRLRNARTKIVAALRALEQRVASRPLAVTGHHGDYWPGNIFIGPRVVEVIDFEGYREGLALEDVAYFLVHLRLTMSYPTFGRALQKLIDRFLDGYHGGDARDADALRLFTIAKALQVIARGLGQHGGLRNGWNRRVLEDLILRSLSD
jgi:glycosyltransferase involved in cell wall biosynthesis/tRNA A-37 threonylcarbamoyl transferase component Bud32